MSHLRPEMGVVEVPEKKHVSFHTSSVFSSQLNGKRDLVDKE